jgi:hypothetical protein
MPIYILALIPYAIDSDSETSNNKPMPPRMPVGEERQRVPG